MPPNPDGAPLAHAVSPLHAPPPFTQREAWRGLRAADLPSADLPPPPQLANQHVYSGSADRTVKCWLADTGERVRTFTAHRHSVSALKYHAGTCK